GATFASATGSISNTQLQIDAGALARFTAATPQIAGLQGSGPLSLGNSTAASVALTIGANNLSSTYSGVISQSVTGAGNTGSIIKTGSGTLTLSGNNTYLGTTTISNGTLQIGDGGTTG